MLCRYSLYGCVCPINCNEFIKAITIKGTLLSVYRFIADATVIACNNTIHVCIVQQTKRLTKYK